MSQATPLEMHLVFNDAKNDILVVGHWINYGLTDNAALAPIFSHLSATTPDNYSLNSFDLNTLLPTSNMESFRYTGSLTTPPFTEGVKWIDLAQPCPKAKFRPFKSSSQMVDARPVQPLNGRIILTDVPGFVHVSAVPEPETYAMLLAGLCLIGFMARRRLANSGFAGSMA